MLNLFLELLRFSFWMWKFEHRRKEPGRSGADLLTMMMECVSSVNMTLLVDMDIVATV